MPQNENRRRARDTAAANEAAGFVTPEGRAEDTAPPTPAARPRPFDWLPHDDRLDWLHALDGSCRLNEVEAAIVRDALRRLRIMSGIRLPARRVRIIDHLIRRHRAEEPQR